jgi:hypothetical protein
MLVVISVSVTCDMLLVQRRSMAASGVCALVSSTERENVLMRKRAWVSEKESKSHSVPRVRTRASHSEKERMRSKTCTRTSPRQISPHTSAGPPCNDACTHVHTHTHTQTSTHAHTHTQTHTRVILLCLCQRQHLVRPCPSIPLSFDSILPLPPATSPATPHRL